MKLSKYPIGKCNVNDALDILSTTNSIVMTRAGIYIYNFAAAEILKRIEYIIHYYMKQAGGVEVRFPTLQHADHWKSAGREHGYGNETFVVQAKEDTWFLAPTAEEQACLLIKQLVVSHKNLPLCVYQISDKFRNELRPRGGLLRSKQFGMKDAYTFCSTPYQQSMEYLNMVNIYINIFNKLGLENKYIISFTDDTGEIGGSLSHEFLVLCEDGDKELYIEPQKYTHINNISELDNMKTSVNSYKYIEVGHLFDLQQIYSSKMKIYFQSPSNIEVPYHMGCYGIGTTRLLQIITNTNMKLPMCISPCFVYLISKDICPLYKSLCDNFSNSDIWWNESNNTLSEKIRFRTYLKLPIMIIYDVYNSIEKYEIHIYDKITTLHDINEVIKLITSMYKDYINFNL